MVEVYTTLLGLNVGVFGVAIAAILVHLEMVTSQYSFRAPHIFNSPKQPVWLAVFLAAMAGTMAGIGLLRSAFPNTDLLPFVSLASGKWAYTSVFLIITSILSGIEYALVFMLIYHYLGYFPVRDVVKKIAEQIGWKEFKLSLLRSNGIPEPHPLSWRRPLGDEQPDYEELGKKQKQLQKWVDRSKKTIPLPCLLMQHQRPYLDTIWRVGASLH